MIAWSDSKKWWMDLMKSMISAFVGILLTVSVVAYFEEARRREAFSWQADQAHAASAIQEFSTAARLYGLWAVDAARDKIRGLPREASEATRRWQDQGYKNTKVAQRSIEQLFWGKDPKLLVEFKNAQEKVFIAFNAAPLFPLGETVCANEEEVSEAWNKHKVKPKILGKFETKDAWEKFKASCFNEVIMNYEQATDAVVDRMHKLTREAKPNP